MLCYFYFVFSNDIELFSVCGCYQFPRCTSGDASAHAPTPFLLFHFLFLKVCPAGHAWDFVGVRSPVTPCNLSSLSYLSTKYAIASSKLCTVFTFTYSLLKSSSNSFVS